MDRPGLVALGAYYIFHFLRLATKPGEALTNLVSTDVRRDEAAAYAAGEVPDPEADREDSRERGDELENVLDKMEHEAGHEVPAEEPDEYGSRRPLTGRTLGLPSTTAATFDRRPTDTRRVT